MFFENESWKPIAIGCLAVVGSGVFVYKRLLNPSRPFESVDSVGNEYNKWTTDGILEHYWGEHIHLGFYKDATWFDRLGSFLSNFMAATHAKKFVDDFKSAKFEFTKQLISWSGLNSMPISDNIRVLDVGCGIGGTSRFLAVHRPNWTVTGISISPEQVKRASALAIKQNVFNVDFRCCDAMSMPFPDSSFDVVWSCESAEHMPDKAAFIKECLRVLKPGGRFVLATWCQRDDSLKPFTEMDRDRLDFLYKEWCHPKFESIQEYEKLSQSNGLRGIQTADWTEPTLPSWRHSIFVGMWSPWAVIARPSCWWPTIREIVTLERMHTAFRDGLMEYGILTGTK
jgi:MPBQ/MSBQ methyltransferase